MEISKPLIILLSGLLLVSFLTALLSDYFESNKQPEIYSGIIYEQPVTDGRYKSITLNNKRVFFSRYIGLNQGDYITLDFNTCRYNQKYNSYDNCKIVVDPSKQNYFLKYIYQIRNTIISNAKLRLPDPHDDLVLAMTIGYEDDLSESLTEKLREIGAIHMLVVSGYNVSLVLNSSGVLLMRFPRWIYITFSSFLLLLFILLTGFDAPIVRSVIMGAFIVIGKAYSRPTTSLYLLILSAIIMVSWDSSYLGNLSFQLSFMATFGVIISGYIFKTTNNLVSDLGASIGASLFVLPIISFYFGTVSILGIISTILLGWLVPWITYLGFLIYIFNFPVLNFIFVVIIDMFLGISTMISQFSFINIQYQLTLRDLTLYYAFIAMFILGIYRVKESLTNETK